MDNQREAKRHTYTDSSSTVEWDVIKEAIGYQDTEDWFRKYQLDPLKYAAVEYSTEEMERFDNQGKLANLRNQQ